MKKILVFLVAFLSPVFVDGAKVAPVIESGVLPYTTKVFLNSGRVAYLPVGTAYISCGGMDPFLQDQSSDLEAHFNKEPVSANPCYTLFRDGFED